MKDSGDTWDAVCDRCEQAFDRVESLLDEGGLAEALRVLQHNEVELRRLAPPSGAIAAAPAAGYASTSGKLARLPLLLYRTGRLLSRCEAMRDRTAEDLRRLNTSRSFQSGPSVAGTWFAEEA
jgi:hypothetical protein